MQHLFPKFGFKKLGDSYDNESGEYLLCLFGNESKQEIMARIVNL